VLVLRCARDTHAPIGALDRRELAAHHGRSNRWEDDMRAFLSSVAAAVIIAVVAMYALEGAWRPADQAFSTSGARVSDPGDNLVGKDWYSSRKF
jgi:hypothetical protein